MATNITPLKFTGISSFSADFQTILDRAVQIASLPVKQMQNQQADLILRKQSLTALGTSVQGLEKAVRDLGNLGQSRALSATSSNTSRVTVQLNGATSATSYTITEITSVARRAAETTAAGFATAGSTQVDADGRLELVAGGRTHSIDLTSFGNDLEGLRDAINGLDAGVTASILDTGSGGTPFFLSLTATSPGATTLQLRGEAGNAATNLLTSSNQGSNAVFKLNGLTVTKSDNVISDVVPGVTFTIQDQTAVGEAVTLNLTSSRGGLASALQSLVAAYNAAADKTGSQIGEGAGLLAGDAIVRQVHQSLRTVTGYRAASGAVRSLTDLGIELDKKGVMSFDALKFYSLSSATIEAGFAFLGSASSGFGALHQKLGEITNPINGMIRTQQGSYDAADRRLSVRIADAATRIERMQVTTSLRLQQADVLLAGLQSQQKSLEGSIKSLSLTLFGRNDS